MSAGPAQSDPTLQGVSAAVAPVQDVLNRDGRRLLVPLFGSVAILFLIACANVAGLLLTRGLQRHPDTRCARRLAPDADGCFGRR